MSTTPPCGTAYTSGTGTRCLPDNNNRFTSVKVKQMNTRTRNSMVIMAFCSFTLLYGAAAMRVEIARNQQAEATCFSYSCAPHNATLSALR